jgi:DNA polymerase elongation subunit (family B)
MYTNIYISRKDLTVHLWDDGLPDSNGKSNPQYASFPFPKYAYKRQVGGKFKSIYGEDLTKVFSYADNDPNIYEGDVPMETRILLDRYPDSDEPSKGHKLGIIDIEVSTIGGFPNIDEADKEITAIALVDVITKTCNTFILDKEKLITNQERDGGLWCPQKNWKPTEDDRYKVVIKSFDDEDDMLMSFMDKWQECAFTIVTGWNIDYFDMPYLYNRLKACLGSKVAKFLSPIGVAYQNAHSKKLTCAGISLLDYILLFKKYSGKNEPSYALGPIGKKVVGIDKVPYHGNLDDLYRTDIEKFIEYNMTDVKIVLALDKVKKFIDLAQTLCHVGHVPYENFHMSSRYLDGAILMYLKRNGGLIAPNKPAQGVQDYEDREDDDDEKFSGAYVKEPVPGMYDWVFDLDLTSMYPNIIISLNISPETKVGKVEKVDIETGARIQKRSRTLKDYEEWDKKDRFENDNDLERYLELQCNSFDMMNHIGGNIELYKLGQAPYSKKDFDKLLAESKYSISSNGVLYRQSEKKIVGKIIKK